MAACRFRIRPGRLRRLVRVAVALIVAPAVAGPRSADAQQVAVEEFKLDNGMLFLLVPRRDQPNVVSAG